MIKTAVRLTLTVTLAAVFAAGCSSGPPKPVKTHIAVAATAAANPDSSGHPAPVVVRVYQLKSDVAFSSADFFALFDDDKKVLAGDLVARDEFELSPGEQRPLEVMVPAEVRFVGALAAYRDIRNSTWRAIVPVPKKGLGKAPVKVTADRQAVQIELGP
jgi:type VI secretion system protein VasD